MDFRPSAKVVDYSERMQTFLDEKVYPAESIYSAQRHSMTAEGRGMVVPPVVEELKKEARSRGLWNLFLPSESGLTVSEYAPIAELSGRSIEIAPEAINCAAPDTGNMEVLHMFGTPEQKERWLEPLLAGEIRSAFAMTEPDVASSDATNISLSITRDGDDYVINGRKWWISGAWDPRCKIFIVMGKTDPTAEKHRQQSMILVERDTPGMEIVRPLPVYGYWDQHGHVELKFTDVRVPATNLIGEEGSGFAIAQARLGPGRIHHCMRALGVAERGLELMVKRAGSRVAFGKPLAAQGTIQETIAEARLAIDQARLLTMKAAWLIDTVGAKGARNEIAMIKVIAPRVALKVLDDAVQVHGGAGVSDDFPLAALWAGLRTLRIADGPDAVHLRSVARGELAKYITR